MKTRFGLLLLALALSVLAAPEAFGAKAGAGILVGSGHTARGFHMECTTYQISCANGKTDTCCADLSTCLTYCAKVCGNPCHQVGVPQSE